MNKKNTIEVSIYWFKYYMVVVEVFTVLKNLLWVHLK
jgi:hypothetical protein